MAAIASSVASSAVDSLRRIIAKHDVIIFSKSYCPHCKACKQLFQDLSVPYVAVELDNLGPTGVQLQDALKELTGQSTVPSVFIGGRHYGGNSDVQNMNKNGSLRAVLNELRLHDASPRKPHSAPKRSKFDLVVIGGGSAGLTMALSAASYGATVAVCDYVQPSTHGVQWGLGGTCVNVGCIPKILMHRAAETGEKLSALHNFGWSEQQPDLAHNWAKLINSVQGFIEQLNVQNERALKASQVTYFNAPASFLSPNKLQLTNADKTWTVEAEKVVLACGKRPKIPADVAGVDHCITSDDIFSLCYFPGKVLCYGGGYIGLETAGFLQSLGASVTLVHRSTLLRGFDRQMVNIIKERMQLMGINFIGDSRLVEVSKVEDGAPPTLRVKLECAKTGEKTEDVYNTVLVAIGRESRLKDMKLESVGVRLSTEGRVIVNGHDVTSCPSIYAIGDVADGRPELASIANQSARFLAERLFNKSSRTVDYSVVPSVLFTPAEYAFVGLTEEEAVEKLGEDRVSVYFQYFTPPRETLSTNYSGRSCAKIVCEKVVNHNVTGYFCEVVDDKVLGLHLVGPDAGEIMQGFVLALKLGLTKRHLDSMLGISGTSAQVFTSLTLSR